MSEDKHAEAIAKHVEWNRDKIGVPEAFFRRMYTDDDWTSVIKLHALIEAGLNRLLLHALKDDRLSEIISRLDTGNREVGKLVFAEDMALLSRNVCNFIRALSKLRNKLVHDVKNFDFHFSQWLTDMPSPERKNLGQYCTHIIGERIEMEGTMLKMTDALTKYPKDILVFACIGVMAIIFHQETGLFPDLSEQSRSISKE